MMKAMRKMTRSILWIVIAAFVGTIVFAWGMQFTSKKSKQGVIAVINGQDVPFQSFQGLYEQKLRDAEKKNEEVTDQISKDVRDQAWSEMVDQYLLAQEVKKKGITVTNKELYEFMKRFPPRELMEAEVFQTDGKFDYNKYRQALSDPRFPWGQVEGIIRSQIIVAKLQENVISAVRINDQEVYRKYVDDTQKARVNYVFIPIDEFPASGIKITQPEIEKFFKENAEKFKMVERAVIKFVEFPKTPSPEDADKVKSRLIDIKEQILGGSDFAEMAKEYSEDQATKKGGGDLGWVKKGTMQKPVDEVIFSLKPGEVSEPVKTDYGWHLIKVLETRKTKGAEEARVSQIVLRINPSEETLAKIKIQAEEFASRAKKMGLDKAGAEEKLPVKESGMFVKGSYITNMGFSEEANKFSFENKPGKISDPIEAQFFYYVIQVKERKPEGIPPLSDAEPFVKQALVNQKQYELAYEKGMKIYEEIKKGKDFKKAAQDFQEKVQDSGELTRSSTITFPGYGQSPEFIGTAFALNEKNQVSPPLKLGSGTFLLQLVYKSLVNDSLFQAKSDSLKLDLLRQKQYQFYTQWFETLKKAAKVEDFRNQYYKETF